ncbi:pyridine nucleotide-disulfide oxidoreductase [Staphylococcus gallinarum]|uniref:Pyridine nucleotide-disulfide oxidoreductase n=1 Tax=Staphylococcus gallinarum TaxID=1293 RepID=A0A3A0VRL4_STAGA|nr:NAD(P)/FAD-dependent oxidoreductase [Staphylococcus gallinarum]RIP35020.1 pyridine nucleotide-disulfide oxidoreductase [Staphylococcus gallinarum]
MVQYTAIIIGAGPAGIGLSIALKQFGITDTLILEKDNIGSSFESWPVTTRFITPSFTTNGFGMPDINAITPDTSPGFTFKEEHINGQSYQKYLKAIVDINKVNIQTNTIVTHVRPINNGYTLITSNGNFTSKYLFIATGDLNFPYKPFKFGQHYTEINDFKDIKSHNVTIIGANESGIDAAINLATSGKKVTIISKSTGFNGNVADPSVSLSPFTNHKFKKLLDDGYPIRLLINRTVTHVEKCSEGYKIHIKENTDVHITEEIIQATGFKPTINPLIQSLFNTTYNKINLTNNDESTIFNNIFLVGSIVKHDTAILCYIYKFRTRFAVLANLIANREGMPVSEEVINYYKQNQMYLEDYSCCEVNCSC